MWKMHCPLRPGGGGISAYPVGSIYMSVNATSPAEIFGGKWEALDEGRVLIGANASHPVGEKGGSETHKLTTGEMPSHSHSGSLSGSIGNAAGHYHSYSMPGSSTSSYGSNKYSAGYARDGNTDSAGSHSHSFNGSVTINSAGGGQAHNNMQPYLSVYMWKRTA